MKTKNLQSPKRIAGAFVVSCALFGLTLPTCGAQISVGTTVVVGMSKTKIVVAADSRGASAKGKYQDTCKIVRLNHNLVFASTGLVSSAEFDVTEEARKSAQLFGSVSPPPGISVTEMVADDWLANGRIKLERVALKQMDNWLSTGLFASDAVSFEGIFMGVETDGKLAVVSESSTALNQPVRTCPSAVRQRIMKG